MTLLPEYRDQLHHAAERRARRPRLGLHWGGHIHRGSGLLRSVPAVLSVLVVVAVAVGTIVALGGGHRTPSSHAPSPVSSSPQWLSRLSDRFSVLREPPTRPPAAVSRTFGSALDGSDLSFARRATLAMGTVWIVPTPSQLCVALVPPGQQEPLGSSCSGIARAEKVGVRLVAGGSILISVGGVVPDGVSSVSIRHTTIGVIKATVTHNAFAQQDVRPPNSRIHDKPPYPTNAAGQTYGSEVGAHTGQEPDLISATGRSIHGDGRVTGYVRRSQLNADSCSHVKTPKAAVACTNARAGKSRMVPIYARNGTTVIGTFTAGE